MDERKRTTSCSRRWLDLAARVAVRAVGRVEPNPLVGAVIVREGRAIGIGHHRRFGDVHAEIDALRACRAAGVDPRGATMYVTLEPCGHTGKQPPCVEALIDAGIGQVVIARADPNPLAAGGAERLRTAGIAVEFSGASAAAIGLAEPFVHRLRTGRPWVIAKWAQTIDGRVATRTGESQWISGEAARRRVHRLRARVDAILTGIGTVTADDPMLNARVPAAVVRRRAVRVVVDANLETPVHAQIVKTARAVPTVLACAAMMAKAPLTAAKRKNLEDLGVELLACQEEAGNRRMELDLGALLRRLAERGMSTVMVEAGPGLLSALLVRGLIDEAVIYMAPLIMGDELARTPFVGRSSPRLLDATRWEMVRMKRVGRDVELVYRRAMTDGAN